MSRYPSLLESSDVDGGSTSAVTMYVAQILESIDQPALVLRILHFLLASPSGDEAHAHIESLDKESPMYSSRRKSLDVLALLAEAAPKPSPTLFNLVDLVLISIRSKNVQTVVATLRLISVIFQRHQTFATFLIKPVQLVSASQKRTIGEFNTELQNLMGIATSIISDPSLDSSYDGYLAVASTSIQPLTPVEEGDASSAVLNPDDGILSGIMDLMARFFTNSVPTNLGLTGVITSLAACGDVSVDVWLLVPPSDYRYASPTQTEEGEEDNTQRPGLSVSEPVWPPSPENTPLLMSTLSKLLKQLDAFRSEITDFDILLAARRDLLINDGLDPLNDELAAKLSQSKSAGGSASGSSTPRGRTASGTGTAAPSILERISANMSPRAASTMRSKSRATTIMSGESSRPQSRARQDQVARDLKRKMVVGDPAAEDGDADAATAENAEQDAGSAGADVLFDANDTPAERKPGEADGVTLGHILTNAVILYEFVLELSAIVQVRAGMLDEITFDSSNR